MKKLTEDQVQTLHKITDETKENFLIINKAVLFDIKKVTKKGKQVREELDGLRDENAEVKKLVHDTFLKDVKAVRNFLGEYADALVVSEDDRIGNFYYSIGVNDNSKVHVTYSYGRDDWKDWNNYVEIDGHKYQKYVAYEIDIYADGYNNENHRDFEAMFNDSDVVEMFEIALQDYIVYSPKTNEKKDKLILTE